MINPSDTPTSEPETISAYLQNRLDRWQREKFEIQLAADADLREYVVKEMLMQQILTHYDTQQRVKQIHEMAMKDWKYNEFVSTIAPAAPIAPAAAEVQSAHQEEEAYEEEEFADEQGWSWLAKILTTLAILLITSFLAFIYTVKTPLDLRTPSLSPNPSPTEVELRDSLKRMREQLFAKNLLATVPQLRLLENHPEASEPIKATATWYKVYALTEQLPFTAEKELAAIEQNPKFAYSYSRFERWQMWCRIQWAKLMGWKA